MEALRSKRSPALRNPAARCYRPRAAIETPNRVSTLTSEGKIDDTFDSHHCGEYNPSYDRESKRRDYRGDCRTDSRRVRQRRSIEGEDKHYGRDEQDYGGDYKRKQTRFVSSKTLSGMERYTNPRLLPFYWWVLSTFAVPIFFLEPHLMEDLFPHGWVAIHLVLLVYYFDGASIIMAVYVTLRTFFDSVTSAGSNASRWDHVSPLLVPIHACGSSVQPSSRIGGRSHKLPFSTENSQSYEDGVGKSDFVEDHKYGITESMFLEIEYSLDRAWYDWEESSTMIDADRSLFFPGDEASFQKKEAELAKQLVRRDGTKMMLAESKWLYQRTADNVQWEDRQLLRSGAVCGTEVQMDFDEEDEHKVMLLVHDIKPFPRRGGSF